MAPSVQREHASVRKRFVDLRGEQRKREACGAGAVVGYDEGTLGCWGDDVDVVGDGFGGAGVF